MPYIDQYYDINVFNIRHILVSSICTYSIIHVCEFKVTNKSLGDRKNEYKTNVIVYPFRIMNYFES